MEGMSRSVSSPTRTDRSPGKEGGWTMRNASTGALMTVATSSALPMPETVKAKVREAGRALALSVEAITLVTGALRAAKAKSRNSGEAVQFTVEVDPKGLPRIVAGEPAAAVAPEIDTDDAALERTLAAARVRGRNRVAEILAQGNMLSAEEFARHLNTTRATINAKRQGHQVLGLEGATRGFRYPEWQIGDDGRPFEELPALFEALGGSPWAVYRFLVQHHLELDGLTGHEALRRKRGQHAIEAARSISEAFA